MKIELWQKCGKTVALLHVITMLFPCRRLPSKHLLDDFLLIAHVPKKANFSSIMACNLRCPALRLAKFWDIPDSVEVMACG